MVTTKTKQNKKEATPRTNLEAYKKINFLLDYISYV
jgi:hypothetical protein